MKKKRQTKKQTQIMDTFLKAARAQRVELVDKAVVTVKCPACGKKPGDEVLYYDHALDIIETLEASHPITAIADDGEPIVENAWEDQGRNISEGDGDYRARCNGCGHKDTLEKFGIADDFIWKHDRPEEAESA